MLRTSYSHAHNTLLVASTGGHLDELWRMRDRIADLGQTTWVTFRDPQSESMLADEQHHFVPYISPRDARAAAATVRRATAILRSQHFTRVISTGSAVAVPFMVAARAMGITCQYIESAARPHGPSLTGRILAGVPGVSLHTQYPEWQNGRWQYAGSLFDPYQSVPATSATRTASRVVVTLGTMRAYGFRAAVETLSRVLPEVTTPDADIVWQVGATDVSGLGIRGARERVPFQELGEAVEQADLVVAHAGIGSTLGALDAGHIPVLLPRRAHRGEHVDDHQTLIAGGLEQRGLAVVRECTALSPADLETAMAARVHRVQPAPLQLGRYEPVPARSRTVVARQGHQHDTLAPMSSRATTAP